MQTAILLFIIPVISVIFTCAFLMLWWNDRGQKPVLAFAASFGLLALAVVLNIWILESVSPFGIVAYNLLSMGGLLMLMWGIAKRADVKTPLVFSTLSLIAICLLLWIAVQAGQTEAMRLAQNTHSALVTTLIAASLWYGTKRNWADHVLMWTLAVLAGFSFVRPVLTSLLALYPDPDGSAMSVVNAVHILMMASLLTLIALSLIASVVDGTMQRERELAAIDPLTGLSNRAAFEEHVEALLEKAGTQGVPVALIVGDIDEFKVVNDTWGHSAGDKVISALGSLIEARIRENDLAGRIGGEEFCIAVWNCSEASAVSLANRLRLSFSNALISNFATDQRFTVSFGVTQWQAGEAYARSFSRADKALYAAKRAGRNRVEAASSAAIVTSKPQEHQPVVDAAERCDPREVVSIANVQASKSRA
jgi:diguanylate cyclase (GGDEF)-like protein